jgi:hypothetical protein
MMMVDRLLLLKEVVMWIMFLAFEDFEKEVVVVVVGVRMKLVVVEEWSSNKTTLLHNRNHILIV